MISTVIRISCLRLLHNRSELLLTFVVPIAFFSIFAMIFGSREGSSGTPKIKIAISDNRNDVVSQRAIELLHQLGTVRIHASDDVPGSKASLSRLQAEELVKRGSVSAAIIFDVSQSNDTNLPTSIQQVQLISDSYDQVATQVVSAVVQKVIMMAQADSVRADKVQPSTLQPGTVQPGTVQPASFQTERQAPVDIQIVDVLGGSKSNPTIAMYAAGIAVMFLLFSATTASGSLLEERESSTLERLLASKLTMDQLLMGKWCYLVLIGCCQMLIMFAWGQLVFGVNLLGHFDGFIAMTLVTVGAASSFALMLAAACQSRNQLNWVAIVVILTMSALGGSMVPRYLMSEQMRQLGLLTFNAWALDGYNKVFWRELPISEISTELGVLTACGFIFLVIARILAIRWERC